MHMVIAQQLQEYRSAMKKMAEEQPEFLDAVIRYSEIRQRYEQTTGNVENDAAELSTEGPSR